MTTYRVSLEVPASLTLAVVTALADADGVELVSSDPPVTRDENLMALSVQVEGEFDAVADAIASVRGTLPTGASIEITTG